MKIYNNFEYGNIQHIQWEETPEGFLRIKARVLQEGVLSYDRSELQELPQELDGVNPINMFIGVEELSNEKTMRSLEGAFVTSPEHTWVEVENVNDITKGSAVGASRLTNSAQEIDLLITNTETISQIKNKELQEISGGYRAETIYSPGEWNGMPFHIKQVDIFYNHIAVIPKGHGRGGSEVRILNQKTKQEGNKKMTVRIKLRNTGKYINVDEEVAPDIEADQEMTETKAAGMDDKISQLEEKNAGLEALQAEIEELKGELSVYKEKLDDLLAEENIEHAAEEMVEETGEAEDIVENAIPDDEDKKQEFKNSLRKIHGTKLHNAVLTAIGVKTEGMSPEAMRGAFKAQHQILNSMGKKKTVAGAKMIQNAAMDTGSGMVQRSGLERLGFGKK